ncbi:MAG: hypothetical protein J6S53_07080 [Lentisphaeria bacterium]|nr:hypothetical protein [Lentisphaeria bacterium]
MKKTFVLIFSALLFTSALFMTGCCGNCPVKNGAADSKKSSAETSSILFPVAADGDMISGFTTSSGAWAKSKTVVTTSYDSEKLFLRFQSFIERGKKLKYGGKKSDDMAIFGGENVEIFLCTEPETGKYFQFAVNPEGFMYSALRKDPSWEPENVKVKTEMKKDFWTMDISIPFKTLGLASAPAKGTVWHVNFCRNYHPVGYREVSNFAGISSYHDTKQFCKMVFEKKGSQSRIFLNSFQYSPGKVKAAFSLENVKEPVSIEIIRGDFLHKTSNLPPSGTVTISAEFPSSYIPIKDMEPVYVRAVNSITGKGLFSRKLNVTLEERDMLVPDKFYYTAQDKKVSFVVEHPRSVENSAIKVTLSDRDGKKLKEGVFSGKGSFDISGLSDGSYVLSAVCSGGRTDRLIIFNKKPLSPVPLKKGARLALKDGAVTSGGEFVYLITGSSTGKPLPKDKFFNFRAGNFGDMPYSAQISGTPGKKLVRNPKTAYTYPEKAKYYAMLDKHFAKANPASPTFHRFTYEAQIPTFLPGKDRKGYMEVHSGKFHTDLYRYFKAKYPSLLFSVQTDASGWVKELVDSCDIMEVCPYGGYGNATIEYLKKGLPNADKDLNGKPRIFWTGVTIPNNKCRKGEELRAAIYLHIIYGSSGTIMHMGHGALPASRTRLWSVIRNLNAEIASFYPKYRSMPLIADGEAVKIKADKDYAMSIRGNDKEAIMVFVSLSSGENKVKVDPVGDWKIVSGGKSGKEEILTPYEARVWYLKK